MEVLGRWRVWCMYTASERTPNSLVVADAEYIGGDTGWEEQAPPIVQNLYSF